MKPEELSWLAGLLEGEGYFGVGDHLLRGRPHIDISVVLRMTDEDVVDKAALLMGRVSRRVEKRKGFDWKIIYMAKCSGYAAAELMELVFPLMGNRRSQRIEKALAFWNSRPNQKARANQMSKCHPDRPSVSHGICRKCYKNDHDANTRLARKLEIAIMEQSA